MKKILFYCQHILGIGHLIRSMQLVRGLSEDFEICFINGGEVIPEFEISPSIEVINLPALKTDTEFQTLQVVGSDRSLAEVQEIRKNQLLQIFDRFQPDLFLIELFPFGRKQFRFELLPLLDRIQATGRKTKVVCSLRDIVVGKKNQVAHEAKVCDLMNQYFDLLLVHSDRHFMPLDVSFSRSQDLNCPIYYTGYVVQPLSQERDLSEADQIALSRPEPMILTSIGGGRFGHELVDAVLRSAPILAATLPHHIHLFAGPFMPEDKYDALQQQAAGLTNLTVRRYTGRLLDYMQKAELSISMGGYNTTMNVLTTGVRSLMLTFMGNGDREQEIRALALQEQGILTMLTPEDLETAVFTQKVLDSLQTFPAPAQIDLEGVAKTTQLLKQFAQAMAIAA
ncbi:MAG: glycosyltransferase [Synechococcales bacterium]|nr:glycosyltransferase [Synechococcales bacterium]